MSACCWLEGEAEGYAEDVLGNSSSINTDIGGGWWSYGVGAQFKVANAGFAYTEIERSAGGEVTEDLRWNVGFRYVW